MKKYVGLEFSYFDNNGNHNILLYTGREDENVKGLPCNRCGKPIEKYCHIFQNPENGGEWYFGTECIKYVWGAGLKKHKP